MTFSFHQLRVRFSWTEDEKTPIRHGRFLFVPQKEMMMYLSYFGIRVTDLNRSLKFYTELLGLKEVARGDNTKLGGGTYVLLRDPRSGQKLELNWYPKGSTYSVTYSPGEGLDHLAFRVNSVAETVKQLAAKGVQAIKIPDSLASLEGGVHVSYVQDPDGNWIELYDKPQPVGPSIPEGY